MPAELTRLPVRLGLLPGEALDGYLERLAAPNGYTRADLIAIARADDASSAFLTTRPDEKLLRNLARLVDTSPSDLRGGTLAAMPGIDLTDLDPRSKKSWRNVAARGWAPTRGSSICPLCLGEDGVWRIQWRHPWVTACLRHHAWLVATCPACARPFRSHRTPLRPVDNDDAFCGNPHKVRGQGCRQRLTAIATTRLPSTVVKSQQRLHTALRGEAVLVLGQTVSAETYLAEVKALAVLLLHLARQPAAERLADWVGVAREDHHRTAAGRGARWAMAPPADLRLRGLVLSTADQILCRPTLDRAAGALRPWIDLVPETNEGQLGWVADHTTMTPHLTRALMATTSRRRRLSTLLRTATPQNLPITALPQVLPAALYDRYIAEILDVAPETGRLFAALCLAHRIGGNTTWATSAEALELPAAVGPVAARACSAKITVPLSELVIRLDVVASALRPDVNYPARRTVVRHLARDESWYRRWSHRHRRGSPVSSKQYAVAWLWTRFAAGRPEDAPGWPIVPPSTDRLARYRRYASGLSASAKSALTEVVCDSLSVGQR